MYTFASMPALLSIAMTLLPRGLTGRGRGDLLRRAAHAQLRRRARARGNSFVICTANPPSAPR